MHCFGIENMKQNLSTKEDAVYYDNQLSMVRNEIN